MYSTVTQVNRGSTFAMRCPTLEFVSVGSALREAPYMYEQPRKRKLRIDNLLIQIHSNVEMIRWTGLAPWELEFPFPGGLTSTFRSIATPPVCLSF